ncbi:cytochrome c-type protein NapC [Dinoroseobacter shibae DFL 12 = DSM 16493]|jgi:cytochrome c-type protein NapC|uniref:Cytochrome c-type protein NapC n=1 Tax=Dinoroseobacter shibae (strain DSM 16493 / NCIMB 14021 / DFL 12) TaxID=398580 RepID=A8LLY5_DINSH|nr:MULTISPECIES: NapC/NirT family cytochrome c [Dinoroseobacter]ABV94894.1 cytochrome c-type protein NapC [Dinoroseobacter shibae DFL 12 = DSM 16493]MDD9717970.1 NapC/NirT family cytochrome c [Dinoroseobacter sp. PD6]URF46315.1 NapC/NirT family cytochrome c [Dinoroseobacter shibae]URF50621.1 NapC/NirT family cytochrome c [Dinoroseobacter shibae]
MADSPEKDPRRKGLMGLWDRFWLPTTVFSVGFVLIGGFVAGILFWGGFHWTLEATNKEEFCVSCHTMETNLGEYRETIHYNNHSGVRAVCADCHVPKEWNHKMKAKIIAVKDVYHEIVGTISTPEDYEEHRLAMASAVWTKMKKSNSRECRNCHEFEYMDFTLQENRAAVEHQRAIDTGMTCIDCHQGIAHSLPPGHLEEYQRITRELAGPMASHADEPLASNTSRLRNYLDTAPAD